MKVFIDCGTHCGCSIRKFVNLYSDASEYKIFSFEASPLLMDVFPLDDALRKVWPVDNCIVENKAVWIYDGIIKFGTSKLSGSGSLLEKKIKYNNRFRETKMVEVECFDFSSWIKSNFSKDDYIILKVDIEGAEYEIFEKMFEDKTWEYINELHGEWHNSRVGYSVKDDKRIMDKLESEYKIVWKHWSANCKKKNP